MAHSVTLRLTTLPATCLVPMHSTYSQCLSSSYRLPFRWRRWRSRCFAAADQGAASPPQTRHPWAGCCTVSSGFPWEPLDAAHVDEIPVLAGIPREPASILREPQIL